MIINRDFFKKDGFTLKTSSYPVRRIKQSTTFREVNNYLNDSYFNSLQGKDETKLKNIEKIKLFFLNNFFEFETINKSFWLEFFAVENENLVFSFPKRTEPVHSNQIWTGYNDNWEMFFVKNLYKKIEIGRAHV